MSRKVILSSKKRNEYLKNAEIINFLRQNPIYACEKLLGISLIDSQAWVLQNSWHTPQVMWTCSRNWGKSFMVSVIAMLKLLLYPNIKIYILSNKGSQAQETFMKLEQIAKQRIDSIPSLTDIFINEVETSANSDGFIHNPGSYRVSVHGGGTVFTLNSVPDNIRGKRANLLIFDESSFCSDELIDTALPFIAQDSGFVLSADDDFDPRAEKEKIPNQVIYASSAGDITSKHAKLYRDFAKRMVIGDRDVFCADITVDIPLAPRHKGVQTRPLITESKVKADMRANHGKAMREYYNKFDADGGSSQIIKWANIRRNETFDLPQMASEKDDEHFAIAFDPAHGNTDDSIITVMKIIHDSEIGYYGEIVNCMNMIDINKEKKMNLKFTDQGKLLKKTIQDYSTKNKLYYEGIGQVSIDAGAGGHGTSYGDELLEPWTGEDGITRKGLIDRTHKKYKEETGYGENKDILRLVNPSRKNEMISNLITLMRSDLIKFPRDHNGSNQIAVEIPKNDEEVDIVYKPISIEEVIALKNIDILKSEAVSIHQYGNSYAIEKSKQGNVGDDRFDTLVMLADYLYELRRGEQVNKGRSKYNMEDFFVWGDGEVDYDWT